MALYITDDFSITKLFASKDIHLTMREDGDNKLHYLTIHLHTVRDFYESSRWNIAYQLITRDKYKQYFSIKEDADVTPLQAVKMVLFDLGQYGPYRETYNILREQIPTFLDDVTFNNKQIASGDLIITEEIWNYIIYILKLSYGEKTDLPLVFDSEESRKFWLAQKALNDKIARLKAKKDGDKDALIKIMLSITYAFPSLTIDYLFSQTMAQIQWLQQYAAKSVSYEVNAQAFAAGNMKKGQKLDFFIK